MAMPLQPRVLAHSGGVVRLAQITDTHLGEAEGSCLLNMDTDHSLRAVLELLRSEQPALDLLLATGDLSDKGSPASYSRLAGYLSGLELPVFTLPGNHDDRAHLASICTDDLQLLPLVEVGPWQIVMLDSQVVGEVGGELGPEQLDILEAALARGDAQQLHTLVCLHHQPVPMGSGWIDQQQIADSEALFSLLDRYKAARGLLWGHVHQASDKWRGGLRLMSTPSTCVQFAPGSERFKVDDKCPGYRWLELYPDGRIDSGVSRVSGVEFCVDLDSGGYS
ncbi:MAG: 3',5'-cyclic-AMP phosphodiesterase [Pseudomonadota bacterium]